MSAARRFIDMNVLAICAVLPLDEAMHDAGLRIAEKHRLSIYEAMIVASALSARCSS